jgi:hypothetical protein
VDDFHDAPRICANDQIRRHFFDARDAFNLVTGEEGGNTLFGRALKCESEMKRLIALGKSNPHLNARFGVGQFANSSAALTQDDEIASPRQH